MTALGVQFGAAIVGDLDAEVAAARKRVEAGIQGALFEYAGEVQAKWRQDFAQSRLRGGDRLGKTVRVKRYRNDGLDPAAVVYSAIPAIVRAFEEGAAVTVADGKKGALVPNPDVWGKDRVRRPRGRNAKATSTFAVGVQKFGPLQYVATPGHGDLIGIYLAKLSAGGPRTAKRLATQARRGRVVVFYVIHEPRLPQMLRGQEIRRRAARDSDDRVQVLFDKRIEAGPGAGPALLEGPAA